jgi:hypothetical protein
MTGREKVFVVSGFFLLGVFLVVYFASRPGFHRRYSAARVQAELRANIRPGMGRAEVEAYLDRAGFPHSYIAGNGLPKTSGIEWVLIRNTSHGLVSAGDIQVRFQFDENEHLTDYFVREISSRDLAGTNQNVHRNH